MPRSSDPEKAAVQDANLLPGLSSDPDARAKQLANLKQGRTMHGAKDEKQVRPLRERYLQELRAEFPAASERRLVIQAHRLAQLELLGAFTDANGVIRRQRTGEVYPAAQLAERIASAYLAEHERLEALRREAAASASAPSLEAIAAELAEDPPDAIVAEPASAAKAGSEMGGEQ